MSGKSPNSDESEKVPKIVVEAGDVPPITKEEEILSPLRAKEEVKSPDLNPPIQSTGRGLAAMTALAHDTNCNQGIVFKSHNLSFDSLTHKIPINLVSRPRCLPLTEKIMCREQFSGPICASRTLRKGGYV